MSGNTMSVETGELAKRITAAKHGFPAHIDRQGVGHYVLKLSASELDALTSQAELLIEAERWLDTCAWQLEMLSTEWRSQIPGAIAVQCGVKAEAARSLLLRIQAVKG